MISPAGECYEAAAAAYISTIGKMSQRNTLCEYRHAKIRPHEDRAPGERCGGHITAVYNPAFDETRQSNPPRFEADSFRLETAR
jgi:hypothetical protein